MDNPVRVEILTLNRQASAALAPRAKLAAQSIRLPKPTAASFVSEACS